MCNSYNNGHCDYYGVEVRELNYKCDRGQCVSNQYIKHDVITKELLDSIKVGDLVKCNELKKPDKVVGVSENYFLMIMYMFGSLCYSVCEKKQSEFTNNNYTKGSYRIGGDDWIGGNPDGYKFDDENLIESYLKGFEDGTTQLSSRTSIDLKSISLKPIQL